MSGDESLRRFRAHEKAVVLFDHVVMDLSPLAKNPSLQRLISQQFASADSIASNIEEGYGRGSSLDYSRFLLIARGSAQETAGRYKRLRHWLPEEVVLARTALCDEIIAILTASIRTLRAK
ncbi:MAG: four helix bundle protein [Opitutaceae bacterium]